MPSSHRLPTIYFSSFFRSPTGLSLPERGGKEKSAAHFFSFSLSGNGAGERERVKLIYDSALSFSLQPALWKRSQKNPYSLQKKGSEKQHRVERSNNLLQSLRFFSRPAFCSVKCCSTFVVRYSAASLGIFYLYNFLRVQSIAHRMHKSCEKGS